MQLSTQSSALSPQSFSLPRRSARFYWRTNLGVILGVAAAGSALTGALLVGDSLRASLRHAALGRLGRVVCGLEGPRYFREQLAEEVHRYLCGGWPAPPSWRALMRELVVAPLIVHPVALSAAGESGVTARANLLGVDSRFWQLSFAGGSDPPALSSSEIALNEALAGELGVAVGDDVLLRAGLPAEVSPETLLGRREGTVASSRLTVRAIIPAAGLGNFSLRHGQPEPRNAFVALPGAQRILSHTAQVNALLIGAAEPDGAMSSGLAARSQEWIDVLLRLEDFGLRLRGSPDQASDAQPDANTPAGAGEYPDAWAGAPAYLSLESEAFLLPPQIEQAAREAASEAGLAAGGVLSHLANAITRIGENESAPARSIPYSIVTALEPSLLADVAGSADLAGAALAPGEIWLNDWAARDLGTAPGDRIELSYFMTGDFGRIETRSAVLRLAGIVPMQRAAADAGFTPEYRGVTDTEHISDWDPPFPVDLTQVRKQDEDYWDSHRTTPKGFLPLEDGQRLWADQAERFGRLTSLRLYASGGEELAPAARRFESALLRRLGGAALGLSIVPLREQALAAARGNVDFAGLFMGFSLFLILSAALLVALLLRLGVELRAGELGLLLAVGFTPRRAAGVLLAEGLWLAAAGGVLGLVGACGFAWLMLAGLRGSWSAAVQAPFLRLHIAPLSLLTGWLATMAVAALAMILAIRGLTRRAPRALLAGDVHAAGGDVCAGSGDVRSARPRRWSWPALLAVLALALAAAPALGTSVSEELGFFGSGAALLAAALVFVRNRLQCAPSGVIASPGWWSILRLGLRNAPRHPGRSTMTITLVACATFVIAAMQAFRLSLAVEDDDAGGGTGGFELVAESAAPLLVDLNTPEGREALGLRSLDAGALQGVTFAPFRLRPGDDASCTNLYAATQHRIAGASEAFIERGGFAFADWLRGETAILHRGQGTDAPPAAGAPSGADAALPAGPQHGGARPNPWRLLDHEFDDGAIPAIGDAAAVKWQLHLGLGQDLVVTGDDGQPRRLRFVALLDGSILQDEIIVSQRQFTRLFPQRSGYSFFLMDAPRDTLNGVATSLEKRLNRYGFDVRRSSERLAAYRAVQNTYLSVFQSLGGLGLVLGSCGLGAVLLRNVWERRGELALLRAVGFARGSLTWLVLAENAMLVGLGLAAGLVPAAVAVAPHLLRRPQSLPIASLLLIVAGVLLAGLLSSAAALRSALRAPLVPALRKE